MLIRKPAPPARKGAIGCFKGFILWKMDNELQCLELTDLRLSPSISDTIDGEWFAEGYYSSTFDISTLENIIKSAVYMNVIRRHKNLINEIRNMQRELANLKK